MRETFPIGGHALYDRLVAKRIQPFYDGLLPRFAGAKRVVDVGCGPGRFAAAIAAAHPAHVVGYDLDPRQVKRARRLAADNLQFHVANSASLPEASGSTDVALTSESLHHWSDPAAGLRDMRRILKPEGRAIIIEACGDISKDELRSWFGRVPVGFTSFVRWIFRSHGFTTDALHVRLIPLVEDAFEHHRIERKQGWWIIEAGPAPFS